MKLEPALRRAVRAKPSVWRRHDRLVSRWPGGAAALAGNQPLASAWYFSDAQGNVAALVYTNLAVAAEYAYDPFGNLQGAAGPLAGANRYRFSSKEWEPNAGLYYYGYRFYDPNLQRWVNRDPLADTLIFKSVILGGGLHRSRSLTSESLDQWQYVNSYEAINNCPLLYVDALGFVCWGQVAGGVGELASIPLTVAATLAGEVPTLGLDTIAGVAGVTWGMINGPIDIIGGLAGDKNPLPANPGAALGSLAGSDAEQIGAYAWDGLSLFSDSAALARGESLGLNAAQLGLDSVSAAQDVWDGLNDAGAGGAGSPSLDQMILNAGQQSAPLPAIPIPTDACH